MLTVVVRKDVPLEAEAARILGKTGHNIVWLEDEYELFVLEGCIVIAKPDNAEKLYWPHSHTRTLGKIPTSHLPHFALPPAIGFCLRSHPRKRVTFEVAVIQATIEVYRGLDLSPPQHLLDRAARLTRQVCQEKNTSVRKPTISRPYFSFD